MLSARILETFCTSRSKGVTPVPADSVELSSLLPAGSVLPSGERHQVPTSDGGQLHAVAAGAGTPLVLTHGALLSLDAWALLWRPLLAAGHRLIGYDLRGHGQSTLGRSGFGVHAYAQDLAAVLDHFEIRGGVVVGHSTGGIGALAMAVTSPADAATRLAGQVLISTTPQGLGDSLPNRMLAHRVLGTGPPGAAPPMAGHHVHPHAVRVPP
jgi:non-heme chloroperoxidase